MAPNKHRRGPTLKSNKSDSRSNPAKTINSPAETLVDTKRKSPNPVLEGSSATSPKRLKVEGSAILTPRPQSNAPVSEASTPLSSPLSSSERNSNGGSKRKRVGTANADSANTVDIVTDQVDGAMTTKISADAASRRSKRARVVRDGGESEIEGDYQVPYAAATVEEKCNWKGWTALKSDPAIFNLLLHEIGASGVKFLEVMVCEEDTIKVLGEVQGLMFCFQYQDRDAGAQQFPAPNVWFANQVHGTNSCGSVAVMNMLFNIPSVVVDTELQNFKDCTTSMTPDKRGQLLDNFHHVKSVHNSFANIIDIMQSDLDLKQAREHAAEKAARQKRATIAAAKRGANVRNKTPAKKPAKKAPEEPVFDNYSPYHYVVFMNIGSAVYKLDGLDAQPQIVALANSSDWIDTLVPLLKARFETSSTIEFNLMALVKDPVVSKRHALAQNIKYTQTIEAVLDNARPDWREFLIDDEASKFPDLVIGVSEYYGITTKFLDDAVLAGSQHRKLDANPDADDLLTIRIGAMRDQVHIRKDLEDEMAHSAAEREEASRNRVEHGPFIQAWMQKLAEVGELKTLTEKAKSMKET
jgi:ubiquitin carboxyl-terminal hydrolase L5